MVEPTQHNAQPQLPPPDGIDFNKLRVIVADNIAWIILIFIITNAVAYLIIRYTKDLYESVSEIKLDVKNDATELGFTAFTADEPQNADLISGEIEIIRSKLFLNIVLDSMKIDVGYYSRGDLLNHELFTNTPYIVDHKPATFNHYNVPIYLEETGSETFSLVVGEGPLEVNGRYNEPVSINGGAVVIRKNPYFVKGEDDIEFFFIVHSRDVLLNYIVRNLSVEPLNFYAKTIRVAFKDNHPQKAQAIIRTIDAVYLTYSHEQKNQANKQKIDWLNNELRQIEAKMEGYEDYFKRFTLENKTNNLDEDLKNTVSAINRIDSQRYEFTRRINALNPLIDGLRAHELRIAPALRQELPEYVFRDLDHLQQLLLQLDKLKLSYNEITFAYRELQREIDTHTARSLEQLMALKADWIKKLQEISQQKSQLETQFVNMPDKSTQFSKNERYYKLYEEFYLSLMQSKSGFEIAKAGTTTDFKILSPATLPDSPISPNRLM
ncbi:MAG TPA: Wzz/FepE/Etk N-terminal domain-containing protein, partial [Ohtaekwangia sp.]|nr:Wzz/FepE/Etk N-terminal domain-containing protein [Ohtaekwangia sp.]